MADYTDYQQRALYGAGQSAQRAGQRFHMERDAWKRGDKDAAKYHRSRANALNRAGAYAAVRGMGGNEGKNQYFPVQSSGQPIYSTNFPGQFALSSQGKEVFDQFRDSGFVEPIRQKKRYAPNTEGKGLGWLMEKALGNTMMGRVASSILPKKKPKPDDAYYKSLWGQGLNEMYSPSGIFSAGKFLGKPQIDPYYRRPYKGPEFLRGLLEPFVQPRSDAFGVVRDSSIPEDWEFMQETPMDYTPYVEPEFEEEIIEPLTTEWTHPRADSRIEKYIRFPEAYPEYAHLYPGLKNKSAFPGGLGDEFFPAETEEAVIDYTGIEDDYVDLDEVYVWSESGKQLQEAGKTVTEIVNDIMNPLDPNYDGGWDRDELIEIMIKKDYIKKKE